LRFFLPRLVHRFSDFQIKSLEVDSEADILVAPTQLLLNLIWLI
jgi:hypothetical protein